MRNELWQRNVKSGSISRDREHPIALHHEPRDTDDRFFRNGASFFFFFPFFLVQYHRLTVEVLLPLFGQIERLPSNAFYLRATP